MAFFTEPKISREAPPILTKWIIWDNQPTLSTKVDKETRNILRNPLVSSNIIPGIAQLQSISGRSLYFQIRANIAIEKTPKVVAVALLAITSVKLLANELVIDIL